MIRDFIVKKHGIHILVSAIITFAALATYSLTRKQKKNDFVHLLRKHETNQMVHLKNA